MKKLYIFSCVATFIATIISFICFAMPNFYSYHNETGMYIGGYGSSISKDSSHYISLAETNPVLLSIGIILVFAIIAFTILSLVFALRGKSSALAFLFLRLIFVVFLGSTIFFSQFTLGSSSINGVAGAWKSSSTVFELATAGGWFMATNVISFILTCVGIVVFIKEGCFEY
jgi:hypothetical protein